MSFPLTPQVHLWKDLSLSLSSHLPCLNYWNLPSVTFTQRCPVYNYSCNSVSNPPLTSLAVAATRTAATILLVAILLERKALEVAAYNDDIVSSPTIVLHVKISVSLGYIYFPICMFMYRVIFPPHKHDSNHTKVRLLNASIDYLICTRT